MHRFFTISLIILALAIGAAGAAPAAHAQGTGAVWSACFDDTDCASDACINGLCAETATAPAADTTGNAPAKGNAPATPAPITAGQGNPTTLPATPDNSGVMSGVMISLMGLFAWLLGVAAITLDNAVYYTVITMGDYISQLSAVGVAWRILRDLSNIMLIFGFLAIGITTILNVDWYGGGTKLLPKLLIAAVLLNFSLFITEAVIDTGNLFATQFYTQINGGQPAGEKGISDIGSEGISVKIMSQLKLATIYGSALSNTGAFKAGNTTLIGFMSIILFLVAAFVMFSLAFILIARFVILIFLIIFAPIGFIGYAVPMLSKYGTTWKDMLIKQTITAPVLFLLLYIALAIITDVHFLGFGPTADWSGFVPNEDGSTNLTGFASMILSFLVAMGLLLIVVIASKSLSAFGAGWATKWAGKATFGAVALAGRSTIGWGSSAASRAIRTSSWGGTKRGRLFAGIADRGAKGSFDVRGTGVFQKMPGNVDAGAAQKGGYQARRVAAIKGHQDYIKSVGEAIEEKNLPQITEAQRKRVNAEEEFREPSEHKERLDSQIERQKTEVGRLEKIEAERVKKAKEEIAQLEEEKAQEVKFSPRGAASLETEQKLATARQNLKESDKELTTARQNLEESNKELEESMKKYKYNEKEEALTEMKKAEKKVTREISSEKRGAQLAYAESIKGVTSWAMYGPGGGVAANKIVKDALKKEDKMKKIKELINEDEKEEKSKKGEGKGEEENGKNEGEKPEEPANKSTP